MNKLVEKVLSDKRARNGVALATLALSAVVMTPWNDTMSA